MSVTDKDLGLDAILKGLIKLDGSSFKAGLMPPTSQDVVDRGARNELGVGVTARPFMRTAVDSNPQEVTEILTKLVVKTAKGEGVFLKEAAVGFENLIKAQIADSPAWAEGNRPGTIAAKGFDHPLIDTSEMHDSISSEVKAG